MPNLFAVDTRPSAVFRGSTAVKRIYYEDVLFWSQNQKAVNVTLGELVSASVTNINISANVNQSLALLSTASGGVTLITGSASNTLGVLASSGYGSDVPKGVVTVDLGELTAAAAGVITLSGSIDQTLEPLTSDSATAVAITGSFDKTLGEISIFSRGIYGALAVGEVAASLDALSVSASGKMTIAGTVASSLDAMSASSAATIGISADFNNSLGLLSTASGGVLEVAANVNSTLGVLTASAVIEQSSITPEITRLGTIGGTSANNSGTFDFGSADDNLYCIVSCSVKGGAPTITVDGNTLTVHEYQYLSGVYIIALPAGGSNTVLINGGGGVRTRANVYKALLNDPTPVDGDSAVASGATLSATSTGPWVAVCAVGEGNNNGISSSGTGFTVDDNFTSGSSAKMSHDSLHGSGSSAGTQSVTFSGADSGSLVLWQ